MQLAALLSGDPALAKVPGDAHAALKSLRAFARCLKTRSESPADSGGGADSEGLVETGETHRPQRTTSPSTAGRAEEIARALYAQLRLECSSLAAPLAGPLAPDAPEHRLWFTQAVCLWTYLGRSAGGIRVSTLRADAHPLDALRPDLPADPEPIRRVRCALQTTFGWSVAELDAIEAELGRLVSNLEVKQALAAALGDLFEGREREVGPKRAALDLMHACYGPLPLRPGDVDLVVTQAHAYFCVPHGEGTLCVPDFYTRPAEERERAQAFVQKLEAADTPQTDRFPAFGHFDPSLLDADLCHELWQRVSDVPSLAGIRESVVRDTLVTMLQILPTHRLGSYLVHDCWGHGWQETLCEFEWLYARATHLCDPVGPESGSFLGDGAAPPLRSAFVARDGQTTLDEQSLRASVEADLGGRVLTAMNGVLSEVLADIADHKLVRLGLREPSASLLAERPVRFDLIVQDVDTFAELWSHSYRELLESPTARAVLRSELAASGCPESGLSACIDHAAAQIRRHFEGALYADTDGSRRDSAPDLATQLLLSLAGLAAALEAHLEAQHHAAGSPLEPWLHPESSIDLICLLLAWFYEQGRAEHLWRLADLLRDGLAPNLARFGAELRRLAG